MKPETSLPQINPENFGGQYNLPNIENAPQLNNPEANLERSAESAGRKTETNTNVSDANMAMVLPMPVLPVISDDNFTTDSSYPLIANDDDLIEKEWVDKAKKIIAETKDDPYQREKEVSKLQVDYIKKRYGRELGVAE